mmetsp:Transcript_1960/g.5541  ORF Transcript_1960/g.5541 Transcript_1960/m.5541 type:complete len:259 (-) Transcript_1960:11-787(-)
MLSPVTCSAWRNRRQVATNFNSPTPACNVGLAHICLAQALRSVVGTPATACKPRSRCTRHTARGTVRPHKPLGQAVAFSSTKLACSRLNLHLSGSVCLRRNAVERGVRNDEQERNTDGCKDHGACHPQNDEQIEHSECIRQVMPGQEHRAHLHLQIRRSAEQSVPHARKHADQNEELRVHHYGQEAEDNETHHVVHAEIVEVYSDPRHHLLRAWRQEVLALAQTQEFRIPFPDPFHKELSVPDQRRWYSSHDNLRCKA